MCLRGMVTFGTGNSDFGVGIWILAVCEDCKYATDMSNNFVIVEPYLQNLLTRVVKRMNWHHQIVYKFRQKYN